MRDETIDVHSAAPYPRCQPPSIEPAAKRSHRDLASAPLAHGDDRGAGGMSGRKSGHRVAGSSKVELRPNGAVLHPIGARMLNGEEHSLAVKQGPHSSAPTGARKKRRDRPRFTPSVSTA